VSRTPIRPLRASTPCAAWAAVALSSFRRCLAASAFAAATVALSVSTSQRCRAIPALIHYARGERRSSANLSQKVGNRFERSCA
jgi:hypothetical protein